jgi:photosystem II stability/assembly factor-like uncharacterized protein
MRNNANSNKLPKTLGERVFSWTKSIVALATVGTAVYAAMQGGATWEVLQSKVDSQSQTINEQSQAIGTLSAKLDQFKAREAGRTEGKLMAQLSQLKEKLSKLKARKLARAASTAALRKLLEEAKERKVKPRDKPKPRPKRGKPAPLFQRLKPLPTSPFSKTK